MMQRNKDRIRSRLSMLLIIAILAVFIPATLPAMASTDLTEGGTAYDSLGTPPNNGEGPNKAFDNTTSTKWNVQSSSPWLAYDFSGTTAYAVNSYTIASANDSPNRDPKNWQLQGSNDGTTWTTVDTRSNITFASRLQVQTFTFTNTTAYQMYRLNITANFAADTWTQLSELQLFASTTPTPPPSGDLTEGGTASDSLATDPNHGEGPNKAFDNTTSTKWSVQSQAPSLTYDFSGTTAYAVNSYTIASANDSPNRDPKNWQLQGSNDGTTWTTVDTRSNITFASRLQVQTFTFTNTTAYQMYRLNITANFAADTWTQLSELQLFASTTPTPPPSGDLTEGGTASDSLATDPNHGEGPNKAFDNTTSTKWSVQSQAPSLTYDFSGTTAYAVNSYTIASANDSPNRDPKNWQLQGSNDGTTWTTVDTRSNITFASRLQVQTFTFTNTTAYQMYRLNITANFAADTWTQLSELQLFASTTTTPTPPSGQSVSVTLGANYAENGIASWAGDSPGHTNVTLGGISALQTNPAVDARYIYSNVSDAFIFDGTNIVVVNISYYDTSASGNHGFNISYDSTANVWTDSYWTYLEGSNTWKTASYIFDNAKFAGRENGSADFRINTDVPVAFSTISVLKASSVPVTGVSMIPSSVNIITGKSVKVNAIMTPSYATNKVVSWSSSNPSVATVNSFGVVTGVAAGTAIITATTQSGSFTATSTVNVSAVPGTGVIARNVPDFLNSIGIVTHIGQSTETVQDTVAALNYTGIRTLRVGGWAERANDWISIYNQTGVKSMVMNSNPNDNSMSDMIYIAKRLANVGALIGLEGPNEPNNFPVTYQGQQSTALGDFTPVARWQRDLYSRAKSDPVLRNYPVFHSSEAGGSEPNNVGLQFLTIPTGAGTLMPDGTQYADYANIHNYVSRKPNIIDNMTWLNASSDYVDWIDGIYQEYGDTWRAHFPGYTNTADRALLPKVSTETGWPINSGSSINEEQQARLYLNLYLAHFTRGFDLTYIYMLRDGPQADEIGYGIYNSDWTPKKSAVYLHNLTTILADNGTVAPGRLNYAIPSQPATVHELLLKKSNGKYYLVVWNERASGSDNVTVNLGASFGTVKIYDPTTGTAATQTLSNVNSVNLTLSDHPVVIEI